MLAFGLVVGLHGPLLVSAPAAQERPVRLEGDGLLGPDADKHRGTRSSYGYEGTPHSIVPAMVALASVGKDDVVYEPGCGDARLLVAAIQAGAGRGVGVDIDPDLAEVSYAKVKAVGLTDRIEIYWGNALQMDMSQATVVFLFMGDGFNRTIRPMLWKQLPIGARVVSNDFAMGDWRPDRTVRADADGRSYVLYLWTITPEVKAQAAAK